MNQRGRTVGLFNVVVALLGLGPEAGALVGAAVVLLRHRRIIDDEEVALS